jgi:cystathionine beta-lyase/cystathionine gamma-synthase
MTRIDPSDLQARVGTRAVHAGQIDDPLAGAIMPPIYQTSTYRQQGLGQHRGYEYGRSQNPTREALERNIASLEGGQHGLAFASGLATLDAVLKLLKAGDHVVSGSGLYGGSHRLMVRVYENLGLRFTFVDARDPERIAEAITPSRGDQVEMPHPERGSQVVDHLPLRSAVHAGEDRSELLD